LSFEEEFGRHGKSITKTNFEGESKNLWISPCVTKFEGEANKLGRNQSAT
jgi:hypothetical protein